MYMCTLVWACGLKAVNKESESESEKWKGGPMRWGTNEMGDQWDGGPMSSNNVLGDQWVGGPMRRGPMRWGTNERGDQWADPCQRGYFHLAWITGPLHRYLILVTSTYFKTSCWLDFLFWHLCMMTSSNGTIFRVTDHLCREFTGPGEFPAQRPVTRSFDVFFDLRPNKILSKQPWDWWFETPPWSLWRQCNGWVQ